MVVVIGYYYKQVDMKPNLQEEAFDTEANKREVELLNQDPDKATLYCKINFVM